MFTRIASHTARHTRSLWPPAPLRTAFQGSLGFIATSPFTGPPGVVLSWDSATACRNTTPTVYNSVPDSKGRRWGTEAPPGADVTANGTATATCAFKDADGGAIVTWQTAPR